MNWAGHMSVLGDYEEPQATQDVMLAALLHAHNDGGKS